MQDVQEHSSVSKQNNGAIHRKLQSAQVKASLKCYMKFTAVS